MCAFLALFLFTTPSVADERRMLALTKEAIELPSNEQAKKIELYTHAIKEFKDFYLPWTNRAVCYLNYGKWEDAINDATQAIALAPQNPHGYGVRGRAYAGKRQFDQAFRDLNRALELAGSDEESRNLYNDRGNAYYSARRYDEAIRDYQHAVDIDSRFAKGFNNLGIAYRAVGDLDRAILSLNTAIKLDPQSPRALVNRARVYMGRQDPVMAGRDLNRAVELDPADASVLLNRGMFDYMMGDLQKARADIAAAFESDPANPYTVIWRFLTAASLDLKDDARVQLQNFINDAKDQSIWPIPIARALVGQITSEQLMQDARRLDDDARVRERLAEAYYYLAQRDAIGGDQNKSREELNQAVSQSVPRSHEYLMASIALSGWGTPQPPPARAVPAASEAAAP